MRDISALRILLSTVLLLLLGFHRADAAATNSFTANFSGTIVSVALGIDNDSCTSSSPFTCTDLSGYSNYSGNIEAGGRMSGPPLTGQSVTEDSAAPGTGCSISPKTQKSCTLGAVTDACEYTWEGGSFTNQKSATGDLVFGSLTPGGTVCVDFNSAGGFALPYNFSATRNWVIAGGTGNLNGITGTFTQTVSGQVLSIDQQGHHFAWFTSTSRGTTP